MNIGNVSLSSPYMGQLSAMGNRSGFGGISGAMAQKGAMGSPPDPVEIFNKVDEDEDGSLNETEAQSLADMISKATGEEMDAEALLATYDTDEDGVLSEEEATAALEANRPEGPPPQGGMPPQVRGSGSAHTSAIESYLQTASQGAGQGRESNMFAMFDGSAPSDGFSRIFSVDTRI